jgi:hypothetical protein
VVQRFDLHEHIVDCFWKPLYNHHARLDELKVPFVPDFVIDDHPEIINVFTGVLIQPAVAHRLEGDREMWRVYDEIATFAQTFGQ